MSQINGVSLPYPAKCTKAFDGIFTHETNNRRAPPMFQIQKKILSKNLQNSCEDLQIIKDTPHPQKGINFLCYYQVLFHNFKKLKIKRRKICHINYPQLSFVSTCCKYQEQSSEPHNNLSVQSTFVQSTFVWFKMEMS